VAKKTFAGSQMRSHILQIISCGTRQKIKVETDLRIFIIFTKLPLKDAECEEPYRNYIFAKVKN
jgi:hypothetical protein